MTDTIESLSKRVRDLEAFVAGLRAYFGGGAPAGVTVATDTDLDGRYGDPLVKVTPRDWKGPPRKNERMSRCEPEFLDMLAETLEHFASKNDAANAKASNGKPKSFYDRADAARARGWAKRLREGWQAKAAPAAQTAASATRWGTSGWGASAKHGEPPEQKTPSAPPPAMVDDPYAERDEPASGGDSYPADWDEEDDRIEVGT